jgi:hypothetical protein
MVSAAIRAEIGATSIVVYLYQRSSQQPPETTDAVHVLEQSDQHCDDQFHNIYLKSADIAVDTYKKNINMLTQEIMNTILSFKEQV